MNEEIGQVFVVDWSFLLILAGLAAITLALFVRRLRMKRRARHEERRKRRREYRAWLRNSGVQPLSRDEDHDPSGR
ncbi:hypothetical protein [Pseudorhodoferax sp. Leaf265]|uniref:hypothetical protein n=1 Tax=unclassified Pseudorhodoferax TaxID=2638544 RepID=UPI0006FEC61F|nr:hypothetical protein [Pseudorhodoferax sp. Leaf265]KQP17091.1 hypothetical protein ASF45_28175 [Pseudorhodoferax sp. Leaf265]PZQ00645.1 MAG: hypothetical protein DI583_07540 [Variovorax paradoxus]PZQ13376.1 MAG: hypothetical protein DI587_07540 [Variovorax paradoxus]